MCCSIHKQPYIKTDAKLESQSWRPKVGLMQEGKRSCDKSGMQVNVTKYLYPHCRCDVTTSSLHPPFPNPIQYRSLKIAASLTPIGMKQGGGQKPEEGLGKWYERTKESEKQISERLQCVTMWNGIAYVCRIRFIPRICINTNQASRPLFARDHWHSLLAVPNASFRQWFFCIGLKHY